MAFKWTKASRAKLSKSQKANGNGCSSRNVLNVPLDSLLASSNWRLGRRGGR